MIWGKAGKMHWRSEEEKPFVAEVKIVKANGAEFSVWRVKAPGLTKTGRCAHPVDAMSAATAIVREQQAAEKAAFEADDAHFKGNVNAAGMA